MRDDPFPFFTHLTLGQLGQLFGVSAHEIGRWLVDLGLKLPQGQPTERAVQDGLVQLVTQGSAKFPAWEKEKAVALLEKAGFRRKSDLDTYSAGGCALRGPFKVGKIGRDGCEIVGSDNAVGVVVRGEDNARRIAAILSIADKCGKLRGEE